MQKFELFQLIDEKLTKCSRLVIAIDGGAASGKTTLAAELAERYGGSVIHMDDFFLQPHQRTQKRLSEAGGNLDRERFQSEVIPFLRANEGFSYQRFDCPMMALGEMISVPKAPLFIVEGSYSHHPAFGEPYDLKIFLHTDVEKQASRILARNGEKSYEMFKNRWIPMENRYFEAFSIENKANIVIEG